MKLADIATVDVRINIDGLTTGRAGGEKLADIAAVGVYRTCCRENSTQSRGVTTDKVELNADIGLTGGDKLESGARAEAEVRANRVGPSVNCGG